MFILNASYVISLSIEVEAFRKNEYRREFFPRM